MPKYDKNMRHIISQYIILRNSIFAKVLPFRSTYFALVHHILMAEREYFSSEYISFQFIIFIQRRHFIKNY